jgi:hypothetical protein
MTRLLKRKLEMTKIATLKAQAKNLKSAMAEMGMTLTQAQALETIAKQYGIDNWDTLSGMMKKEPAPAPEPRLADMPLPPTDIWVEGLGPRSSKCTVDLYAFEALQLLHDEKALRAYVEANPDEYCDGMDSTAIYLFDDGRDHDFTFNQLLGIRYVGLGEGKWLLRDAETHLRFCCDDLWRPEDVLKKSVTPELMVPELVKSARGCQLIILSSSDGVAYDHHVIVPSHLKAEPISRQIAEEILRLKAIDRENNGVPGYDEYTDADLAKFVTSLGCLWVVEPVMVRENWD